MKKHYKNNNSTSLAKSTLLALLILGCFASYGQTQLGADMVGVASGDLHGTAVAASSDGNLIVIGSPGAGSGIGSVSVMENKSKTWALLGSAFTGSKASGQFGSAVAIARDSQIVAVGAPLALSGGKASTGEVNVYKLVGSKGSAVWTSYGSWSGGSVGDKCGASVALSDDGSYIAIGYPGNGTTFKGFTRIYYYNKTSWGQFGADIIGEANGDLSGSSVSISSDGQSVAIGAPGNDGSSKANIGHVRVYNYDKGSWVKVGADIDGESTGDKSGTSVSISSNGTIVAIGAPENTNAKSSKTGHVRVYSYATKTWIQMGSDIDGDKAGDKMGASVSLDASGRKLAVGAPKYDGAKTSDNGVTRVFSYSSSWAQSGSDIVGDSALEEKGAAVFLSGDGAVVACGSPLFGSGRSGSKGVVRAYSTGRGSGSSDVIYASVSMVTCASGSAKSDGVFMVDSLSSNFVRYGTSTGSKYSGPAFAAAAVTPSSPVTVDNKLANPKNRLGQPFVVRGYFADSTYQDKILLQPYQAGCKDVDINLTVEKASLNVNPGERYSVTYKATNDGSDDSEGITIKVWIPSNSRLISAIPSGGKYDRTDDTWHLRSLAASKETTLTLHLKRY